MEQRDPSRKQIKIHDWNCSLSFSRGLIDKGVLSIRPLENTGAFAHSRNKLIEKTLLIRLSPQVRLAHLLFNLYRPLSISQVPIDVKSPLT
jgi:hypothetical protein